MGTKRMDLFGKQDKDIKNLPPTKIDTDTGRKLYLNKITGQYE